MSMKVWKGAYNFNNKIGIHNASWLNGTRPTLEVDSYDELSYYGELRIRNTEKNVACPAVILLMAQ